MKLNNLIYIKLFLSDYIIYSIVAVFLYFCLPRIITEGVQVFFESFNPKDFLIVPLAPFSILFLEGIPYFLIFNFLILSLFIYKSKKITFKLYVISTVCSHLAHYLILLATDWHIYTFISMPYENLNINKIFIILPSLFITIILNWLLFHRKFKKLDQEYKERKRYRK